MSYLSLSFILFVTVVLIVHTCSPSFLRKYVLLAGSVVFYLMFDPRYILFLLFTALSTFACARIFAKSNIKKLWLTLCIAANIFVLLIIKDLPWILKLVKTPAFYYVNFLAESAPFKFIVPVGISYFTLQAIGYLADVYKEKITAEKSFLNYLLFLSYFPAIVQGPISRYDALAPKLLNSQRISFDTFRKCMLLILFGLVKKMVIADRLSLFVNYYFSFDNIYEGIILYIAAVAYSIQLYTDFSGCVDLCRGVSGLFGVELIDNFNRPYFAQSIKEFWGRWHISLSSWLKDYIYIPLGGNRKGTARKYLNLLITFLVSGLWHGTGFNFILWGILHAAYQIFSAHTADHRQKLKAFLGIEPGSSSDRFYNTFITFNLVAFAWIFFRASSILDGVEYITNMFSTHGLWELFDGTLYAHGMNQNFFTFIVAHICILFILEKKYPRQEDFADSILQQHIVLRWIIYLVLLFDVLLFGVYGSGYSASNFLYGGF